MPLAWVVGSVDSGPNTPNTPSGLEGLEEASGERKGICSPQEGSCAVVASHVVPTIRGGRVAASNDYEAFSICTYGPKVKRWGHFRSCQYCKKWF